MIKRFIIDEKNKSFVFKGYCYGYVRYKKLHLFTNEGETELSIRFIDINKRNRGKSTQKSYLYSYKEWVRWGSNKINLFHVEIYPQERYVPDFIFPSDYYANKFVDFIKLYQ